MSGAAAVAASTMTARGFRRRFIDRGRAPAPTAVRSARKLSTCWLRRWFDDGAPSSPLVRVRHDLLRIGSAQRANARGPHRGDEVLRGVAWVPRGLRTETSRTRPPDGGDARAVDARRAHRRRRHVRAHRRRPVRGRPWDSFSELPGILLTILLVDRAGRRRTISGIFFAAAACFALMLRCSEGEKPGAPPRAADERRLSNRLPVHARGLRHLFAPWCWACAPPARASAARWRRSSPRSSSRPATRQRSRSLPPCAALRPAQPRPAGGDDGKDCDEAAMELVGTGRSIARAARRTRS